MTYDVPPTTPEHDEPTQAGQYLFYRRPRCGSCDSPRLLAYRTTDNHDGTTTRYVRCGQCGEKFILVLE